ncbi:MAG: hypothetical protein LBU99_03360 [Spirochaetaceae bacterium]|jgi:hypothetical protein|nr:hypothetical protein [Spirochaetaceae bacterium]
MKRYISLVTIFAIIIGSGYAFDILSSPGKIEAGFDTFIGDLAKTIPDTAVLPGTWSDGYIGKLLPSIPPHFGIGGSFGVTKVDTRGLNEALAEMGIAPVSLPKRDNEFVLPAWAAEARIGGLFLPFDLGVKFAYLDAADLFGLGLNYKYTMAGGDIRYAIIEQGLIKPNLSIGFGYTYISGDFGFSGSNFDTSVDYKSHVFALTAQLSKSIIFITPYIGARLLVSKTEGNWAYATSILDLVDYDKKGSYEEAEFKVSGQVFGGVSLNIFLVKLNLAGSYNFITQVWGASAGLRVQL